MPKLDAITDLALPNRTRKLLVTPYQCKSKNTMRKFVLVALTCASLQLGAQTKKQAVPKKPATHAENQQCRMIESVLVEAYGLQPPMRAYVLDKASPALSKCFPIKTRKTLLDAFRATMMIPETEKDPPSKDDSDGRRRAALANVEVKTQLQIEILRQLVHTNDAEVEPLLRQAEPSAKGTALELMIDSALNTNKLNRALSLLKQASPERFPYSAATRLMLQLSPERDTTKQEIFSIAMAADQEFHSQVIGGDDFGSMIVRFWKYVPPAVSLEAISQVLDEAKSNSEQISVGSGINKASFSSAYEYRVFELLPVLRELDSDEADRVIRESTEGQAQLKQFPNGIQSLNPAIRDTPLKKGESDSLEGMVGPSIAPMLQESSVADDSERQIAEIVQKAESNPKQAIEMASALPASAGNNAPRAEAMLKIAQAVGERAPSVVREALERMSESLNNVKPIGQAQYKDYFAEAIGTAMKIGEVDFAKKLLSQGMDEFEKLEAIDADSDDPNVALKAWWPSTAVLLRLISSAVSISEQTADEVVRQISDPELRILSQLRLANLQLHIPMGESVVQMMSSKSSWGQYQMETEKN
jgi:hypothetical protein